MAKFVSLTGLQKFKDKMTALISSHINDTTVHVTSDERNAWNNKAERLDLIDLDFNIANYTPLEIIYAVMDGKILIAIGGVCSLVNYDIENNPNYVVLHRQYNDIKQVVKITIYEDKTFNFEPVELAEVSDLTSLVTTNTNQSITGIKTFEAPANISGQEQTTVKFKTSNGGAVILGKEGPNSGTMIRLDQADGTPRLRFRASETAGAMVWEQPEKGARLYIDLGKEGADKHRISFPTSGGTLALTSKVTPASHASNTDIHITAEERKKWNGKADKPTVVTGTLSAGSTSVTLSNSAITTSSVIDIYTNVYGVNPTNVTVSAGKVVLTFEAQSSAVNVRIEVK